MRVLFLSPHYPEEMQEFTRGLAEVGAQVIGVADAPLQSLPAGVRRHLAAYIQVKDGLFDPDKLAREVVPQVRHLGIDRVEALWEVCVESAARLRVELGIPGMRPGTAVGFRDKVVMKDRLVRAGVRVPKFARVQTVDEATATAGQIGYPLVIKPVAGAGSQDTHQVDDEKHFRRVLATMGHVPQANLEEYIDGDEFTWDAITIDGEPVFESITQYHPKPIVGRNEEWISPAQITLRDPNLPDLAAGRAMGRQVLNALGTGTGFVHMEWYRKANGEAVFGEIGARSGGAKLVDQMNYAHDIDVYREWARVVCWRHFAATPHRRYHVACVFKRALGQGRIRRIEGIDLLRSRCGESLIIADLLPLGHPRRNWRATLLSDGYVVIRHPDYSTLWEMMNVAIEDLKLFAS